MARNSPNSAERSEWLTCSRDTAYFLEHYGWVYDATGRDWLPFGLWPAQREVLDVLAGRRLVCILKARQLGLTWLALGYSLWLMLFRPAATVLLFSKRDVEAAYLLDFRLRGMYERLPAWLQCGGQPKISAHAWRLSNGSAALAFPTTGGRSYTATLALVDEADYAPDLDALLNAVKPTVDAGGQLILLSTVDKGQPESAFKRVYWAGVGGSTHPGLPGGTEPTAPSPWPAGASQGGLDRDGTGGATVGCTIRDRAGRGPSAPGSPAGWHSIFLPWSARPDRTAGWYAAARADVLARTGFLDDLYQEYPASDLEALAPRSADVRLPAEWLRRCASPQPPLVCSAGLGPSAWTSLAGLEVFEKPRPGCRYVIGADPAEGNPQSDQSAACVLEWDTGAEVASLAGRFDPAVFAGYVARLSQAYGRAPVLVERNNHGHAVLLALADWNVETLCGIDDRAGWLTTAKSKAMAYDYAAERLSQGDARIRSAGTLRELQAVQGSTLRAPDGQTDDRAMAFVLGLAAIRYCGYGTGQSVIVRPVDVIAEADEFGAW